MGTAGPKQHPGREEGEVAPKFELYKDANGKFRFWLEAI